MKGIALLALLAAAGTAQATTFNFVAYTNNSGSSDQIDMSVQVSATANTLSFVITNNSSSGRMATFYMESGSALAGVNANSWSVTDLVGSTSFVWPSGPPGPSGVTPSVPQGGISPGWNGNFFAMEAATPQPNPNSLNAGESIRLTFDHDGTFVLSNLIDAMSSGQLRLAQHYLSWGPNDQYSEWLSTVIIPLPPAGWAGLGTLGLVAVVRAAHRRRRA